MDSNSDKSDTPSSEEQTLDSFALETRAHIMKMQNDTLRWQLAQTDISLQAHVTLLLEMLGCLKRVQHFLGIQIQESEAAQNFPNNQSGSNMPRSQSVHHVDNFGLSSPVKMNSRHNCMSAGNVSSGTNYNNTWNNTKLFLASKIKSETILLEEVTRIIMYASTLLNTPVPGLASGGTTDPVDPEVGEEEGAVGGTNPVPVINIINDANEIVQPDENEFNNSDSAINALDEMPLNYAVADERNAQQFLSVPSPLIPHFEENDVNNGNLMDAAAAAPEEPAVENEVPVVVNVPERRVVHGRVHGLNEDESGFSSLTSFQELGIPIINIIPPSPSKEVDNKEPNDSALHNGHGEDDENITVIWV